MEQSIASLPLIMLQLIYSLYAAGHMQVKCCRSYVHELATSTSLLAFVLCHKTHVILEVKAALMACLRCSLIGAAALCSVWSNASCNIQPACLRSLLPAPCQPHKSPPVLKHNEKFCHVRETESSQTIPDLKSLCHMACAQVECQVARCSLVGAAGFVSIWSRASCSK